MNWFFLINVFIHIWFLVCCMALFLLHFVIVYYYSGFIDRSWSSSSILCQWHTSSTINIFSPASSSPQQWKNLTGMLWDFHTTEQKQSVILFRYVSYMMIHLQPFALLDRADNFHSGYKLVVWIFMAIKSYRLFYHSNTAKMVVRMVLSDWSRRTRKIPAAMSRNMYDVSIFDKGYRPKMSFYISTPCHWDFSCVLLYFSWPPII